MLRKTEAYVQAAMKGADWLLRQQNADGSFITPQMQADVYHKAVLALSVAGHPIEANRLVNWIAATDLQPSGRLRRFDEGLGLYKTSWICQGAHRLGRFDVSFPVMEFILSLQAPCGGFFQSPEITTHIEPVSSAWAATAALYTGHMAAVRRAAECFSEMVRQQPDPLRFYVNMSPDGRLLTGGDAPFVDATRTQQAYYAPGIAMLFLARLHTATGSEQALSTAVDLLEFSMRCAEDRYAYPASGKSAVGAAVLYKITGDARAAEAALQFGDYLLAEQSAEGWWCNPHADNRVIRLDHTAEFVLWLTDIAGVLGAIENG